MRLRLIILCLLFLGIPLSGDAEKKLTVECGDWIEISAKPIADCHFVKWSDGDTMAIRQIQVNEDSLHYIAFFAPPCETIDDIPILALYNWIIMLDVRYVNEVLGYHFTEDNVTWYRIVGDPDDTRNEQFPEDDEFVCKGHYLTLDKHLWATGNYYAVVDISATPSGELCTHLLRTQIAQYSSAKPQLKLTIAPSYAVPGQPIQLLGLDPDQTSTICVYDMMGRLLFNTTSQNETTFYLEAATCPGCYNVVVYCGEDKQTLRYIVSNP